MSLILSLVILSHLSHWAWNKGYHRYTKVCFTLWPTPRNWQWGPVRTKLYNKKCCNTVICIFFYLRTLASNRFQYQMMFVSFNTNTTGVTGEARSANQQLDRRVFLVSQELLALSQNLSSPPVLRGINLARSLVFCVELGNDHLAWRGGYGFFWKNILIPNVAEKNILVLVEGKKIIWFRVFVI